MILRAVTALAVVLVGAVLVIGAGEGDAPPSYEIVFDNAFGLTEGADLRAAGVRVGSVSDLDVDGETARALVTVSVEDSGFGDLREDARCSIEPQSLIGEYFVDCVPGESEQRLADGGRVEVEQTTGTIPPDLVNNILRRPQRERFGIILAELGAGVAARGPELQATIKRAIPALRETDRVLEILADNRARLRSLTRESDRVLAGLAERKDDVARFVVEARDTAQATAERREDLSTNIRLLPEFLRQLRPVLRDLGTTARRQTPALRDLRAAADELDLVFSRLGPFAEASQPALESLGDASRTGIDAMRAVAPVAEQLGELGARSLDPARNLRFVLEHLDDRDFAVEPNPLSPGGEGFTGLEALLQYPFVQSQAINIFDLRGYLLKLNILPSPCSAYADEETVRENPELREQCSAALGGGPAVGIDDQPSEQRRSARRDRSRDRDREGTPRESAPDTGERGTDEAEPQLPRAPRLPDLGDLPSDLDERLEDLLGAKRPQGARPKPLPRDQADALLDFLFAP